MRVMVLIKANKDSEAGILPSEHLLTEMGKFNEELVKAGVMRGGEGLHPSSRGKRVTFAGGKTTVTDGPFAETKELVAGFWLWQVASIEEAVEWVKRCPNPADGGDAQIEIRPVFEADDFGDALTPELRAQEDRLRAQIDAPPGTQKSSLTAKIVPHLWFIDQAVEAAHFYASLFPDSRVDSVTTVPGETPSGPAGSVSVVEFTLAGQPFQAISAGPLDPFNHAISFIVNCDDQAEVDRLWDALSDGGTIEQCGWLRDRYGVSWQIVPTRLGELMKDPDRTRARRVTTAMLKMKKLDIAGLEKAYVG